MDLLNPDPLRHLGKKKLSSTLQKYEEFKKQQPLFHTEDIEFPLSTKHMKIVDDRGKRVKLVGTNWSGGHMSRHSVSGLQYRPLKSMAEDIRYKFHMNCIRLTYSLQMFYDNNRLDDKYLEANPELKDKTSMEIFDFTIQVLTAVGLMVILNNHTSRSMWCCSNDDGQGLWWTPQYSEELYFQCAENFARRYKDNPLVIGMDLRNEIRYADGYSPTWGSGDPKTDWKRAAQKTSQIIFKEAPHWLVFIGGLDYQGNLQPIADSPLDLSVENKLVYTGHLYNWSWGKYGINDMSTITYAQFKLFFFDVQTYVRGMDVPFLLGEFGENTNSTYWTYLTRYLKQTDIDWIYWCLDGYKYDGTDDIEIDETYGIYSSDFSSIRKINQGDNMFDDLLKVGPPKYALV